MLRASHFIPRAISRASFQGVIRFAVINHQIIHHGFIIPYYCPGLHRAVEIAIKGVPLNIEPGWWLTIDRRLRRH